MVTYGHDEEKARLRQRLGKEAVDLALQGDWDEAEAVNRDIIARFPADVEAHNRLGKALTELGNYTEAEEAYMKALELAPENDIARKNLSRLASLSGVIEGEGHDLRKAPSLKSQTKKVAPEFFTTEMGKTGVVNLNNIASGGVLAKLGVGYQVYLEVKDQHLIVETEEGEYLGEVEPTKGLRLIKLIQGGNRYTAAILSMAFGGGAPEGGEPGLKDAGDPSDSGLEKTGVQVVIKEVYQHPDMEGHLSFPVRTKRHPHPRAQGSFPLHIDIPERNEDMDGVENFEEEYREHEKEHLPEGFTVIGEDGRSEGDKREEFEL